MLRSHCGLEPAGSAHKVLPVLRVSAEAHLRLGEDCREDHIACPADLGGYVQD